MAQISTRIPDDVIASWDRAAERLHRSRAEVVRQALEHYLEDFDDLTDASTRIQDPADPVLDWDEVKRDLLDKD